MKAVVISKWLKSVKDIEVKEIPVPELDDSSIEVTIKAVGVNFFDILQVQGLLQSLPIPSYLISSLSLLHLSFAPPSLLLLPSLWRLV